MKYQFCVRFNNVDANSAASKAVLDCNRLFLQAGYQDFTFTIGDNSNKLTYYFFLLKGLLKFYFSIKRNSVVGIQYPLLSVNSVFHHFINAARKKNVTFFCIVHDLESLRTGADPEAVKQEVARLNAYDKLIVHNQQMRAWLKHVGVTRPMLLLGVFDYLSDNKQSSEQSNLDGGIVYAGNLIKSGFVRQLNRLPQVQFNLYGPGFSRQQQTENIDWLGEYTPEEIPFKLTGSFGLIWDGNDIDRCDERLGNYLRYNNPHKFSLYLAAGLPVIAPKFSAIGSLINELNLGILIDNLHDLHGLEITKQQYQTMRQNVAQIREQIISGHFFTTALSKIETNHEAW